MLSSTVSFYHMCSYQFSDVMASKRRLCHHLRMISGTIRQQHGWPTHGALGLTLASFVRRHPASPLVILGQPWALSESNCHRHAAYLSYYHPARLSGLAMGHVSSYRQVGCHPKNSESHRAFLACATNILQTRPHMVLSRLIKAHKITSTSH